MTITDWVQAISMVVLVVVTGIYAWRTFAISKATEKQANASVKMAEEMREQRLAIYKPHITLEKTSVKKGKYFMREIGVRGGNEQGGIAVNVELSIVHTLFRFSKFRYSHPIPVKGSLSERTLVAEESSVEDDPVVLVVANYEDVFGNPCHSTLELHWVTAEKDVTPGRIQVAVPGHLKENKP